MNTSLAESTNKDLIRAHLERGPRRYFTPDASRLLAEDAGCRVIEADGWGNSEAWVLIDLGS